MFMWPSMVGTDVTKSSRRKDLDCCWPRLIPPQAGTRRSCQSWQVTLVPKSNTSYCMSLRTWSSHGFTRPRLNSEPSTRSAELRNGYSCGRTGYVVHADFLKKFDR